MCDRNLLMFFCFQLLLSCSSTQHNVTDEASVIKIAEQELLSSMKKDDLEDLQPFKAVLIEDNTWKVYPRDIAELGRRPPVVYINKKNGKVEKVLWGEGDIE